MAACRVAEAGWIVVDASVLLPSSTRNSGSTVVDVDDGRHSCKVDIASLLNAAACVSQSMWNPESQFAKGSATQARGWRQSGAMVSGRML